MKKRLVKTICVVLVVTLVMSLVFALAGCHRKEKERLEREARERTQSVSDVEDALMGALGEGWRRDLSDANIVLLAAPGDYIVASGWMSLFGDTLLNSALQTAKLKNLAEVIRSDEGKALLEDIGQNADLLLPALKRVGLTREDVSALFYDMSNALIIGSGDALDSVLNRLLELRTLSGLTTKGAQNVTSCIADVNAARTSFRLSDEEKAKMTSAFEAARGAIDAMIAFAYDMLFENIGDEMWKDLFEGEGALDKITDGEIRVVTDALLKNVRDLKTELGSAQVKDLNAALDMLITHFDEDKLSSELFAQVIVYAKYANMFVGAVPMTLEFIDALGSTVGTPEMLDELRNNAGKWNAEDGTAMNNVAVIVANVVGDFLGAYTADSLKGQFDALFDMSGAAGGTGGADMDKMSLLIGIDMLINIINMSYEDEINIRHPDIISEEELDAMMSAAFGMRAGLNRFKESYRAVKRGEARIETFIAAVGACRFAELGVLYNNNEQITYDNIDAVYDFYIRDGVNAVKRQMSALSLKARQDIERYIDEYYAANSVFKRAVDDIAGLPLVSSAPKKETLDKLTEDLKTSGLMGIVQMFASSAS